MRFIRTRALLLALALMLSVHVTAASAAQATAELRAIACCDVGCEHSAGTAPARCCGVERESQQLKTQTVAGIAPIVWIAQALFPPPLGAGTGFVRAGEPESWRSPGVPVFLRTRTLRI